MERNSVLDYDDVLDKNHNRYQDVGEDDAKANKDNRVTLDKNVVSFGSKKPATNETIITKLDLGAAAVKKTENIPTDIIVKPNGKRLKNLASSSLKALKMKLIAKPDERSNIRRVATVTSPAMIRGKHDYEQPNCMVANKLVTFNDSKPADMLADCSRLMNDVIRLDIYRRLISFPWNPGVSLCWI